jgi:hypothetical protein
MMDFGSVGEDWVFMWMDRIGFSWFVVEIGIGYFKCLSCLMCLAELILALRNRNPCFWYVD